MDEEVAAETAAVAFPLLYSFYSYSYMKLPAFVVATSRRRLTTVL